MSEVMNQPPLGDLLEVPTLLACVRQERGSYTARDEERCAAIKEMMILGRGLRAIERASGVSRHTLRRLRDLWTERNELAPLKQRLSQRIGAIVEDGLDIYHAGILDGKVKADQLPVGMGILLDKKASLDGEAGLVVEHRHTVDVDQFRQRLEAVREQLHAGRAVTPAVTSAASGGLVVDVQEVAQ